MLKQGDRADDKATDDRFNNAVARLADPSDVLQDVALHSLNQPDKWDNKYLKDIYDVLKIYLQVNGEKDKNNKNEKLKEYNSFAMRVLFEDKEKSIYARILNQDRSFRARLEGLYLAEIRMRNLYMPKVNFEGANLQGANFRWTNLQEANFRRVDLQEAEFWGTELQGADFFGANLRGVQFWRANLQKANFFRANLQKADFRRAELQDACMTMRHIDNNTLILARWKSIKREAIIPWRIKKYVPPSRRKIIKREVYERYWRMKFKEEPDYYRFRRLRYEPISRKPPPKSKDNPSSS